MDLALEGDKAQEVCSAIISHLNQRVIQLRRLFLVEDLVDSAKFGAFLYFLTYLGAWFNGLTLVILGEFLSDGITKSIAWCNIYYDCRDFRFSVRWQPNLVLREKRMYD